MVDDQIEKEMRHAKAISEKTIAEIFQRHLENQNMPFGTPLLAISMTLALVTQYYSRQQEHGFTFEQLQQTVDVVALEFFSQMAMVSSDDLGSRLRTEIQSLKEKIRNQNLLFMDPGGTA